MASKALLHLFWPLSSFLCIPVMSSLIAPHPPPHTPPRLPHQPHWPSHQSHQPGGFLSAWNVPPSRRYASSFRPTLSRHLLHKAFLPPSTHFRFFPAARNSQKHMRGPQGFTGSSLRTLASGFSRMLINIQLPSLSSRDAVLVALQRSLQLCSSGDFKDRVQDHPL